MLIEGLYGFRKNCKNKITLNGDCYSECSMEHLEDSTPELLGKKIVEFITSHPIETLNKIAESLVMVERLDELSQNDKEKYSEMLQPDFLDSVVETLWGEALEDFMGDFNSYLEGICHMVNDEYMMEYGEIQWVYLINLDTNELEIYKNMDETPRNYYWLCKKVLDIKIPFSTLSEEFGRYLLARKLMC